MMYEWRHRERINRQLETSIRWCMMQINVRNSRCTAFVCTLCTLCSFVSQSVQSVKTKGVHLLLQTLMQIQMVSVG
jgi:hypothetical protein